MGPDPKNPLHSFTAVSPLYKIPELELHDGWILFEGRVIFRRADRENLSGQTFVRPI